MTLSNLKAVDPTVDKQTSLLVVDSMLALLMFNLYILASGCLSSHLQDRVIV